MSDPGRQALIDLLLALPGVLPSRAVRDSLLGGLPPRLLANLSRPNEAYPDVADMVDKATAWGNGALDQLLDNAVALAGESEPGRKLAAWRDRPAAREAVPARLRPPTPPAPWAPRPEEDALRRALLAGGPVAIATEGRGGLGKTALAATLAADPAVCAAYPDGVFWLGLGQTPDVAGLLAALAAALGGDVTHEADEAGRIATVTALLKNRRCLLVLDDVWDPALATRLRPLAPAALLTTRDHAVAREFAHGSTTALAQLTPDAAVTLLRGVLTVAVDPAALARVATVAGGLPLTLRLLAPLIDDKARIGRLPALLTRIEQPAFRAALVANTAALSLAALPAADRPAFAALAVFGPRPLTFDLSAAAAVWAVDEDAAEERLVRLTNANLLDIEAPGLFTLHQSLYDVAATELAKDYPDPAAAIRDPHSPLALHAAYYRALAEHAREDWRPIAVAYSQIERAWEAVTPDLEQTLAFVWALRKFQTRQGLWQDYRAWAERGLVAARALGRRPTEGRLLHNLGWVHNALGDLQQALVYFEQSLPIRQEVGDRVGEAWTLNSIGLVYHNRAELARALIYFEQVLLIWQEVDDHDGKATTLNNIGALYNNQGEWRKALEYLEQARSLREAIGARGGLASTLHNIGCAYQSLGDFPQALVYYEQARSLREAVGDRDGLRRTLWNIARTYVQLGELAEAERRIVEAVTVARAIQHPKLQDMEDWLARVRSEPAAPEGGEIADPSKDYETD